MISSISFFVSSGWALFMSIFVDDRQDLQIIVQGKIRIGQSLCLYSLRGIHDQESAPSQAAKERDTS
jgi:hypothetical protein